VRAYADSSFILRLVLTEPGSEQAIAEYRRSGRPPLFFLPLHALEVRSVILQRAFHQRRALASGKRQHVNRERDAAFRRLEHLMAKRTLLDVTIDMDPTITRANQLSAAYTERMGLRAIDILHVASALTLESELFLTTDERQARLAKAEGLKVASPV
jgi:predicted nucleic acid-binding protein